MKIRFKNKKPIYPIYLSTRKGKQYIGLRKYINGDERTIKKVIPINKRWVDLILPNGDEIVEVSLRSFICLK